MNAIEYSEISRLAIKLKPSAERMVKKSHPWIFADSIIKQSSSGKAGDVAVVFDTKTNKFLACGLFDPDSPIKVKLLQFHEPKEINTWFFRAKINAAYTLRQTELYRGTDSYRLIFGENDGLPGLIADVYADVLVLKLYSLIWLPYISEIIEILAEITSSNAIVLRTSRITKKGFEKVGLNNGQIVFGVLDSNVVLFKEHFLNFEADVINGHKTGYFLDHRHNRKKVGKIAKDKHVLDVFSYAGGFSIHALMGGAKSVTSIDISRKALEFAKRNAEINDIFDNKRHRIMVSDAFEALHTLINENKKYNLVVIDPPSFAKSKLEMKKAITQYQQLVILGEKLTARNGHLVLASCSSRIKANDFFLLTHQCLLKTERTFEIQEQTQHDFDHPIGFPEGAYLKCIYYRFYD
ncbi:MAG: methyltransferase domain-containing protein [Crocinitomicaceae bacterium]|jgi:23S rRNA (cytosine1962-C5)-methyltransferase|nr:methyltransferase domain-containing protein [Crocinitomicaceae bacterium]MBT6514546.1 methyltransferase domain-containing protein [Crocinitomicaceae bacterium]